MSNAHEDKGTQDNGKLNAQESGAYPQNKSLYQMGAVII